MPTLHVTVLVVAVQVLGAETVPDLNVEPAGTGRCRTTPVALSTPPFESFAVNVTAWPTRTLCGTVNATATSDLAGVPGGGPSVHVRVAVSENAPAVPVTVSVPACAPE